MLTRLREAGLVWPSIASVVALAILVGLGNWQWRRTIWKTDLNAQIAARTTEPPVGLGQLLQTGDAASHEYRQVEVRGTLLRPKHRFVYASGDAGPGWHVFVPLTLVPPSTDFDTVWVNLGYVPNGAKADVAGAFSSALPDQTVTGLLRQPETPTFWTGWAIPESDGARNIYYQRLIDDMTRDVLDANANVAGFMIDAVRAGEAWPQGGTTVLKLRNNHFGYALTWWGLALTLVGVYGAFAWQRLTGRGARDGADKPA